MRLNKLYRSYRKIEAVFWKGSCGIRKYTSTKTLLTKMTFQDKHGLKDCHQITGE